MAGEHNSGANYNKIMSDAFSDYTNQADKYITYASGVVDGKWSAMAKPEVAALCGIGNALLAQCVLLERIADRLDEGGIGVEVTQA